jgi:lysozyme family protein
MNVTALVAANATRWSRAQITRGTFAAVAHRLVKEKTSYQRVEAATGVPWFIVAVIHEREASQNWSRSIAQGDFWNVKSTHVPKDRGPFASWYDAAIDALVNCAPKAATWKDWSPGGALTLLEQYNGLGYAYKGLPSPYIWSGTDQYVKGKYVADRVFDPNKVDEQLGCAGLLLAMAHEDPTITFGDAAHKDTHVATEHPTAPCPAPKPVLAPKHEDVHPSLTVTIGKLVQLVFNLLHRK